MHHHLFWPMRTFRRFSPSQLPSFLLVILVIAIGQQKQALAQCGSAGGMSFDFLLSHNFLQPIKLCCMLHDQCYDSCITSPSQATCDLEFRHCMTTYCSTLPNKDKFLFTRQVLRQRSYCLGIANDFY